MSLKPDDVPSDLASAQSALLIEREALRAEREARLRVEVERDAAVAKAARVEAEAASAQAKLSDTEALIAHLQLTIEKLRREKYGQRSERTARLLEQLELQLADLVTSAAEDELAAAAVAAKTQTVRSFSKRIATMDLSRCSIQGKRRCRSRLRFASRTRAGSSSNWPTLEKMLGRARRASRSPRSRWKQSSASMHSSPLSERSAA